LEASSSSARANSRRSASTMLTWPHFAPCKQVNGLFHSNSGSEFSCLIFLLFGE
jgi:hypothetical protein